MLTSETSKLQIWRLEEEFHHSTIFPLESFPQPVIYRFFLHVDANYPGKNVPTSDCQSLLRLNNKLNNTEENPFNTVLPPSDFTGRLDRSSSVA